MHLKIDTSSEEPNYLQIEQQIKEGIITGKLLPNEKLPSIRSLAKDLQIAIITIKRAYDDLEHDGWIVNKQGIGCFVAIRKREELEQEISKEIDARIDDLLQFAATYQIRSNEIIERIMRRGKENE